MKYIALIIMLFPLSVLVSMHAQLAIPTSISETVTLSETDQYYYSNESVTINSGGKLIIEKNVTVKMAPAKSISVNGTFEARGDKENPIIITCTDTTMKWGHIHANSATIDLKGVAITCATKFLYSNYGDISLVDCSVDKTFGGIGADCIGVHYATTMVISGCNLNGNPAKPRIDAIDCDGIDMGTVSNNHITNFEDDGVDVGTQATNVVIENNYIYNCNFGISVGERSTVTATDNVIIGCTGGAMQSHTGSTVQATQNTFYKNAKGFELHHGGSANSGGTLNLNSCIVSSSLNKLYTIQANSVLNASYSISDTDSIPGETNIFGDPLFVDTLNFNFHLKPSSPCINAGDPALPLDTDGTRADIGAFEYSGVPSGIPNETALSENRVELHPVPCSYYLVLKSQEQGKCHYQIMTVGGSLVQEGWSNMNTADIQIGHLNKGLYLILLRGGVLSHEIAMKFIKE